MLRDKSWLTSQMCLKGVKARAPYRSVKFLYTKWGKPFLYGSGYVNQGIVVTIKDLCQNTFEKLEAHNSLKYHHMV